ncbi:MAG TPA: enoyl-CoA hydratase/isomerase family protein [Sporichthyaceae bacterium]|jgi:enoyl-CoA hydratase/carnithine racemase|nr:enoyl-CoA hydratase/isomerase family protein [Sporichthyaceae bacterium]
MDTDTQAGHRVEAEILTAGDVRLLVDGELATVVLDRPTRRNAMTPSSWAALAAVPDLLPAEVRVVLVRSEGPVFCAGIDLRMASPEGVPGEPSIAQIAKGSDTEIQVWIETLQQAHTWLADPRWITVAAVQGAAVGAGFQLALGADIRVVADDARFCMRESALGLVPDLTGTGTLHRLVGYGRALDLCTTARWVDAAEADRLGLVNQLVPVAELPAAALEMCRSVLANSTDAVRSIKELLLGAAGRDFAEQNRMERVLQVPLLRAMGTAIG